MALLYMTLSTADMVVTNLGAMDVIAAKQFLDDPERVVDLSPVSAGASYSCYSKADIQKMAENLGLDVTDKSYGEQINMIRDKLVADYKANKPEYKSLDYYESKIRALEASNPEFYAKFKPEDAPVVISRRHSGTSPNKSNTPKSAPSPSARPAGGTTKKVWDIADEVKSQNPSLSAKDLRPKIIAACEADGINGSTAGTQFAKWKNSQSWG